MEKVLHEFVCRCAERALSRIDNPDPRSIAAIIAKRKWLNGEITDEELDETRAAAKVETGTEKEQAAQQSAYSAASRSASAYTAVYSARRHASRDDRDWQVQELKSMMKEEDDA